MTPAVVFDIGETLIDETRMWSLWADWLEIPRLTFFALLGVAIEREAQPRQMLGWCRPDLDLKQVAEFLRTAANDLAVEPEDLYPDVKPCLQSLADAGYRIGIAGNQPRSTEEKMREWGLPVEFIASSEGWGAAKPDLKFFDLIVEKTGRPPGEIVYVGDRLDHDVLPAREVGMIGALLRRGPWGFAQAAKPETAQADIRINGLGELLPALREYGGDRRSE